MRLPVAKSILPSPKPLSRDVFCPSKSQLHGAFSCYRDLKNSSLPIPSAAFPAALKACAGLASFGQGAAVHADAVKMGFTSHTSTCNTLMSFYLKCGTARSALNLFDEMLNRDSVSWNVMTHGFLSRGDYGAGLSLFKRGRGLNVEPNVATLVLAIQASWKLGDLDEGLNLHCLVLRNGFFTDVSVQNSLLSMYAKLGETDSARRIFDEAAERDVVSWSSLIGGYAQSGEAIVALRLFKEMSNECEIDMDGTAAVSVLQACGITEDILLGSSFHGHLIRKGLEDMFVGNSLIDMYSKCHDIASAYRMFDTMTDGNIVTWNSMISGLVHNEKHWEAVALFDSMRKAGVQIDEVTLVNLLQSCKKLNQEAWCKSIHSVAIKDQQLTSNIVVLHNLLDAYAKCNNMDLTLQLFEKMEIRNVISWSIVIAGFVHIGQPEKAIASFREMWLTGEKPNPITMLSVLEACAIIAELKLSKCAHGISVKNQFTDDLAIGTAVLSMYAKCGDVKNAGKVFDGMPHRNVLSWNAMIGALGMNGRAQAALAVFHEMESGQVKPNEVTILTVLSACSHGGLVEEGLSIFQRMTTDPSLRPSIEHYSCVVDMLGRAGDLEGALEVIKRIPEGLEAGPAAWGALLSACRHHGNCEVGQGAASRILKLEPSNSAGYLLTSSMYAKGGSIDAMARVRLLMKKRGVKVLSGYSLVHVQQKAHKFVSWDDSHPQSQDIYSMVELLHNSLYLVGKNECQM